MFRCLPFFQKKKGEKMRMFSIFNKRNWRGLDHNFCSNVMKRFDFNKKLVKLHYLLENSKVKSFSNLSETENPVKTGGMSQNLLVFFSLVEKPLNLLFSSDQFVFEFSKKTYQQRKTGDFFLQLKERKKLSFFYGHLTRKHLLNLFSKAKKKKGFVSKNIFCLLERRLDVVLYRSGLTQTIAESRQLIKHKKILVNEKVVNVPSFSLDPGDFIEITAKTGENLRNLLKFKTRAMISSPHFVRDFHSKLNKTLNSCLNFEKSKTSSPDFQSKILCNLLIQLLCTKIKSRSFWTLKKQTLTPFSTFQKVETHPLFFFESTKHLKSFHGSKKKHLNQVFLTLLKWKCFSRKTLLFSGNHDKKVVLEVRENPKNFQGYFQKKPGSHITFWNRHVSNLEKKKISFKKSHKNFQTQKNFLKFLSFRKKYSAVYRESFLFFLKSLENSQKFQRLGALNMKQFLLKKYFYKQKYKVSPFSKKLTFRSLRPLNLEISYNLLNLVYLYSPQRVNFPFFLDLDLIQRSLR